MSRRSAGAREPRRSAHSTILTAFVNDSPSPWREGEHMGKATEASTGLEASKQGGKLSSASAHQRAHVLRTA